MQPADIRRSYADAEPRPFWLTQPGAPAARPPLEGDRDADLVVVGAGLTGLWAALLAREEDPGREVVLLEGERIAFGATGRNGGFMDASLTHGIENGVARWPGEMPELEQLGRENFAAIKEAMDRHGIDAGFEETGELAFATEPYQAEWHPGDRRDRPALRLARRGLERRARPGGGPLAHLPRRRPPAGRPRGRRPRPPRLGTRRAARDRGVRVYERSPVAALERDRAGVVARTQPAASAPAAPCSPPAPSRRWCAPSAATSCPSTTTCSSRSRSSPERRDALGWQRRQGLTDLANQFHYYRLTSDDRVLWGGYDAVYNFRNGMGPHLDERPATFELLAAHFFETFPQLEGVRFTHRWGGAIDTCSRFSVMFGKALGGRAVYAVGYTGLGVAASRFGAQVALDLADGRDTERTRLRMVRSKPVPFPPEPLRWAGITLTRRALAKADRREGRRGPWLRMLDRLGMGFDS